MRAIKFGGKGCYKCMLFSYMTYPWKDEQWILSKVHKICKRYMIHIQNSVFEGELSEGQIFKLRKDLSRNIYGKHRLVYNL